jgi:ankyrin repeat protein
MAKQIKEWIDNGNWNKIVAKIKDDLKNKKKCPTCYTQLYDNKTLLHIAVIHNKPDILQLLLPINELSNKSDLAGDSIAHTAIVYQKYGLMRMILKNNPNVINLVNDKNETPLHRIMDYGMLKHILDNYPKTNLDTISHDGRTPLLNYMYYYHTQKHKKYIKSIELLLEKGCNANIPKSNPPLFETARLGNLEIGKMLIDNGANPNVQNSRYETPLIGAIGNKHQDMVSFLLTNGANVNYTIPEGTYNPLLLSTMLADSRITDILLENGAGVKSHDKYLNTPLHYAIRKSEYSADIIFRMMKNSDLNESNIKGDTALHYLIKFRDWKNYKEILKRKRLDIYKHDSKDREVIEFVPKAERTHFLNVVADSYLRQMTHPDKPCPVFPCALSKIRTWMEKNKQSYRKTIDSKIEFVKSEPSFFGMFNANSIHNIIYSIYLLKKFPHMGIPFQYYVYERARTDKYLRSPLSIYHSQFGQIITDIFSIYTDQLFEMRPYLIIWRNEFENYFDPDLKYFIKRLLVSKKIRFIWFKLTIVPSKNSSHANLLLFDKNKFTLERFEPYGSLSYNKTTNIDSYIKNKFEDILSDHLAFNNTKLTYLSPNDILDPVGFQTVSNDDSFFVRKLGDPPGYCLAWTFWYLEMRLKNPDIAPKSLMINAVQNIRKYGSDHEIEPTKIFISYIRDYAMSLNKIKDNFLLSLGIPAKRHYDMVLNKDDYKLLTDGCVKHFLKLMNGKIGD